MDIPGLTQFNLGLTAINPNIGKAAIFIEVFLFVVFMGFCAWWFYMRFTHPIRASVLEKRGAVDFALGSDSARIKKVKDQGYFLKLRSYKKEIPIVPDDCMYSLTKQTLLDRIFFKRGVTLRREGEDTLIPVKIRQAYNTEGVTITPLEDDIATLAVLKREIDQKTDYKDLLQKWGPLAFSALVFIMIFIMFFFEVQHLEKIQTIAGSTQIQAQQIQLEAARILENLNKCAV